MSARYTLLNAAFYGVPQMRERMFLIAYRRDRMEVTFPSRRTGSICRPAMKGRGPSRSSCSTITGSMTKRCYVAPPEAKRSAAGGNG